MERNDVVPFPLVFPPPAMLYDTIGVYKPDAHVFNLEVEVPVQRRVFQKSPPLQKGKGDPMGVNMEHLWEVYGFRQSSAGAEYRPHPDFQADQLYIAKLRFEESSRALLTSTFDQLPLSPPFKEFVRFGEAVGVEREALALAILVQHNAATFKPAKCAAAWAEAQSQHTGSAQAAGWDLLLLARVVEDVERFIVEANRSRLRGLTSEAVPAGTTAAGAERSTELHLPVGRLRKAGQLFRRTRTGRASDLTPAQKNTS